MSRLSKSRLFVINEDGETKLDHGEIRKDIKTQLPFQESVQLNAFKKNLETNKAMSDKDLLFLKRNSTLMNLNEKNEELEKILENYRYLNSDTHTKHKFDNVKSKCVDKRNPNVENFLKDIRNLNRLEDNLKNEFNDFLNEKINNSTETIRKLSILEKKNDEEITVLPKIKNDWNFLTQNENENDKKASDAIPLPVTSVENTNETKTLSKPRTRRKDMTPLDHLDNFDKATAIKLKKSLEHIKRIDLPKFQTEIHQICQYGDDPKLFKLYPQEIQFGLNNKQNDLGRYCVHECCLKGNVGMLKGLLSYVDDINKLDNNNQNAAHIAAKHGELECLKILTANGIDLKTADDTGMQVSHIAARYNHPDLIDFLFDVGISLNEPCKKGKLPFHYAAEFGSLEALKALTDYYIDLSFTDNEGNTAAHLSAKNDKFNCLKFLVRKRVPVDKIRNNLGRNVAHMCCFYGSVRCLHWLFANNVIDKNNLDDFGNTLAHTSCINGQAECLNCCIQHDVDVTHLNDAGDTPFDAARKFGKYLHMEKAALNKIKCSGCVIDALKIKWQKEYRGSNAEKQIEENKSKMYIEYAQKKMEEDQKIRTESRGTTLYTAESSYSDVDNAKRDLVAQYFGPAI